MSHPILDLLHHSISDVLLDYQSTTSAANLQQNDIFFFKFWFKILLTDLSLVEVDGIDHTLHSCIEVSRIEHDKGGFPSQLEGELLSAPSRGLAEDLPHLR